MKPDRIQIAAMKGYINAVKGWQEMGGIDANGKKITPEIIGKAEVLKRELDDIGEKYE